MEKGTHTGSLNMSMTPLKSSSICLNHISNPVSRNKTINEGLPGLMNDFVSTFGGRLPRYNLIGYRQYLNS